MSADLTYLDSSALVKLVVEEPESRALLDFLRGQGGRVSAALARTEVQRAARRVSPAHLVAARRVLAGCHLLDLDGRLLDRAGELAPPAVRSLDAIHLATALSLGDDLDAFVTYDPRQADAAREWCLAVVAPS
ncbi:MAG TPA: type II toxin-antitoxin system VapC family toxin [Candidatus Micrarchaeia archaeon]|nr:type II toxin-antitoxin system VapC family toxin [Candidatus Micrarchaeia archaeon]